MTNMRFGGPWTEQKLNILRGYLDAYTTLMKEKPSKDRPFRLIYVDAFAGGGLWSPKSGYSEDIYGEAQELHKGSPLFALEVNSKPFDKLVFIEKDPLRTQSLKQIQKSHTGRDIEIMNADANSAIPMFCDGLGDFDRAVVFLDPYATEVEWQTIEAIARTEKIDCWILFPLMGIFRLMPRGNEPPPAWALRLDRVFGDRVHWEGLYSPTPQLSFFDDDPKLERAPAAGIAAQYQKRLQSVFAKVAPTGRTLRNSKGAPMFELFFAASNPSGAVPAVNIADYLLSRW